MMKSSDKLSFQNFSRKSVFKSPAYFSRLNPAVHGVRSLKTQQKEKNSLGKLSSLIGRTGHTYSVSFQQISWLPKISEKEDWKTYPQSRALTLSWNHLTPSAPFIPKKEKRFASISEWVSKHPRLSSSPARCVLWPCSWRGSSDLATAHLCRAASWQRRLIPAQGEVWGIGTHLYFHMSADSETFCFILVWNHLIHKHENEMPICL